MKTAKWILVFLVLSLSASAQVKMGSSVEVGYEDRFLSIYDYNLPTAIAHFKNNMTSTVEVFARYKKITVYTDVKTYIKPMSPVEYQPLLSQYRIGANYSWRFLEFKYEHLCSHSVDMAYFHEGYDRVSIKIWLVK